MKLNKFMIAIMVCCIGILSEDAFAIRFPTKAVKKILEGSEHATNEKWHPEYGVTRAGIRKLYKKDSLHSDSSRRDYHENFIADTHSNSASWVSSSLQTSEYGDAIDSKIDSIQSVFYKMSSDSLSLSMEETPSHDSLSNNISTVPVPLKSSSEQKTTFDDSFIKKIIAIVFLIVLLLVAIIDIYKRLPSK